MIAIDLPKALWLSSNQRLCRPDEWSRTAAIRALAKAATTKALTRGTEQPLSIAAVLVTVCYPPKVSRADPPNAWPAAKAAIDGAVDAGLLPDDSSAHLPVTSFARGKGTGKPGMYRLELTFTEQRLDF